MQQESPTEKNESSALKINPRQIIQISSVAAYGGKGILVALCRDGTVWHAEQLGGEFKEWAGKIPEVK